MNPIHYMKQYQKSFSMAPIHIRELFYIDTIPCDVFVLEKNNFEKIINNNSKITKNNLKTLLSIGHSNLFSKEKDVLNLKNLQQENLRKTTRSLSIGNPLDNAKQQLNFLTLNMYYLYEDVLDNNTLNLQVQSTTTLASFLLQNIKLHKSLYHEYQKQKHHYIFAQPLLSSIFLLGILKHTLLYIDNDIEQFFLTSYLKDIGMSFIPTNKYDSENLSNKQKQLLLKHPQLSVDILKGRTPLQANHLKIIIHHHAFSQLRSNYDPSASNSYDNYNEVLLGFETLAISIMDIISAMTSGRPYQKPTTIFESLDFIKYIMADQFPKEFKLFVTFFKQFYF